MATYKRIKAVNITVQILRFLADQREAVTGKEISRALNMSHGTVMCYLATMMDERLVVVSGEYYELGSELALFWSRRKAKLENIISKSQQELRELEV